MEVTKRVSLKARKNFKRKKYRRFLRNIVAYLKSDGYLFAPQFPKFPLLTTQIQTHPPSSNSGSSKTNDVSVAGFEALGIKKEITRKRRMSVKVKEYLKSDCHMYGPMISPPPKLKGKLQITNLVTEQTLLNGRINSPKQTLNILERTELSRETDVSPAFSSVPEEKMFNPDQRRVIVE